MTVLSLIYIVTIVCLASALLTVLIRWHKRDKEIRNTLEEAIKFIESFDDLDQILDQKNRAMQLNIKLNERRTLVPRLQAIKESRPLLSAGKSESKKNDQETNH